MGRSLILGNGSLTVGLDERGLVHDFYYPYVGLNNLTTSRSMCHKIGIWIDNVFSWTDDNSWDISVNMEDQALVSVIRMQHDELQIELLLHDFVDSGVNAFCRQIAVINHADHERNIRIFIHQVFQISGAGRADTALYVPDDHYILDYKGRCCLLVYGQDQDGVAYDQFAVGNYGIEGKEGTFRDAEDGDLSGSAVEHGGVDSVIRFNLTLGKNESNTLDYWIIAADSQYTAQNIHDQLKKETLSHRLEGVRHYWDTWLSIGANRLHNVDKKYLAATKKSLMIIKSHIDKRGGIIASCDSSIYNYGRDYYSYVWPRDGSYAIWPLIRLGYTEEPKKFFEFCRDILTKDGYVMHKYQPDRAIGSTWHPLLHNNHKELAIQEDETAIIIYMLGEYYEYSKDTDFVQSLYETLVQPAGHFLARFIDPSTNLPHASYDLWEERFGTHTYTAAVTYQALLVAADFAEQFEHPDDALKWREAADSMLRGSAVFFDTERQTYRKSFLLNNDGSLSFDNTLDVSSFYGVMMFGFHDHDAEKIHKTCQLIESNLLDQSPSKGVPRYERDQYFSIGNQYLGNPWIVTTLWMAQYYYRAKQPEKAAHYVDWALSTALPSGVLPEQVNAENGSPVSVTPLTWSHAELINTILDLSQTE